MNRNRPPDATHRGNQLTVPDEPRISATAPGTKNAWWLLPSSRYRHPGDVIRLIISGLALAAMLAAAAVVPGRLLRPGAPAVSWPGSDPAGQLLTAVLQVAFVVAAAGVTAAALRHRRFRLLAGLLQRRQQERRGRRQQRGRRLPGTQRLAAIALPGPAGRERRRT